MKKLLAVLLVLCLLPWVYAEESPAITEVVSALSDAELKELYVAVKNELMERKLWDTSFLPAGVYIGGLNLPVGSYELTLRDSGIIRAFRDYETFLEGGKNFIYYTFHDSDTLFTLTLTEGVCWVLPMDAMVRPFTGLVW